VTQLLLFPSPAGEQLALELDVDGSVFRSSDDVAKPEAHQLRPPPKGPAMPTPAEQYDYLIWPLRKLAQRAARRKARRDRFAGRPTALAELTRGDWSTIRLALEDRVRLYQGEPAGEAARIAREKVSR
jgi:hypothetical protein